MTLWDKDVEGSVLVGKVTNEGSFHAPFSEKEIAALKSGESWLTLTVGNWLTKAKQDHAKLSLDDLTLNK